MSTPFIGEIKICSFNFPPKGWALCNGQLLQINQNQALFSLLGTYYGGDGIRTFALPNLQGRLPMHQGSGPGLSPRIIGEIVGEENHTLLATEMPAHSHQVNASTAAADDPAPGGKIWASGGSVDKLFGSPANTTMNPAAVATAGQSQSHNNLQPYLVVNFVIALQGIFPSRN